MTSVIALKPVQIIWAGFLVILSIKILNLPILSIEDGDNRHI